MSDLKISKLHLLSLKEKVVMNAFEQQHPDTYKKATEEFEKLSSILTEIVKEELDFHKKKLQTSEGSLVKQEDFINIFNKLLMECTIRYCMGKNNLKISSLEQSDYEDILPIFSKKLYDELFKQRP